MLLIMAALTDEQAVELEGLGRALDLDVLVEVHNLPELERALGLQTKLIGINNRNLKTLKTDLATTEELAPHVPPDRFLIGESGIRTHADMARLGPIGVALLPGRRKPAAPARRRRRDPGAAGPAAGVTGFSHFDAEGRAAMVDVGAKPETERVGHGPRPGGDAAGNAAHDPGGRGEEGRRARRRADRRDHGGQAHRRLDSAVPSAADHRGRH